MSQVTLDTDKVWDIGKASEATQKRINELSEGLQSQVKGLSHIEDFIQLYDERIERQIRRMKNEANRCGMAASYIFKIAEHYERTDSGLKKGLSIFAPVLDKARAENDQDAKEIYDQFKADNFVKAAITELELGVREHNGDNRTKYGEWYNNNGQPWCAQFVSYCAFSAGILNDVVPKYQGCGDGRTQFGNRYIIASSGYKPKAGDVVFFKGHTGIVIAYEPSTDRIYTIEGNYGNKVSYVVTQCKNSEIIGYGKVGGFDNGTPLNRKPEPRGKQSII